MMDRIKLFLRKWHKLYHLIQRLYYTFWYVIEVYILGTKLQEWIWKTHHIFYKGGMWPEDCLETITHPHRQILMTKIASYVPLESILEIGCSSGANLHLLAREYPYVQLYGIDINTKAIKEGNFYLRQRNITNVELLVSRADNLKQFGDKSIDVVFTDATLMYIGVDKIKKVIEEMRRVSCKGLILSEWHSEDNSRTHLWYDGHWVYNYKILLEGYFPLDNIRITKFPVKAWDDESWRKFGSIIEVKI